MVVFDNEVTKILRYSLFPFFTEQGKTGKNGTIFGILVSLVALTKKEVTKICNEPGINVSTLVLHLMKLIFFHSDFKAFKDKQYDNQLFEFSFLKKFTCSAWHRNIVNLGLGNKGVKSQFSYICGFTR